MSIIPTSKPANPKVINQLPAADAKAQSGTKVALEPEKAATTVKAAQTSTSANKANINAGPLPTQGPQTAKVVSVEHLNQTQTKQLSQEVLKNLPSQAQNSRLVMAELKVINTQVQVITQLPLKVGQNIQVQNQLGALQLLPHTLSEPQKISQQLSQFMPMAQSSKENIQALLNLLKSPLPPTIKETLSKALDLPDLKQLSQVDVIKQLIQQNGTSVEAKLKSIVTQMQTQTSSAQNKPLSGESNNPIIGAKQSELSTTPKVATPASALNKLTQKITSAALQQPAMATLRNEMQKLAQGLAKSGLQTPSKLQTLATNHQQTGASNLKPAPTLSTADIIQTTRPEAQLKQNLSQLSANIIGQKSQILSTLHQAISHLSENSSNKGIQQVTQLLIKAAQAPQPGSTFRLAQPQMLMFNLMQQLKPGNPTENDSDKAIKQLIRLLAGNLANIATQQLNSAQLRQHAEPGQSQWQMDLPYIEQQQAGNLQLEIEQKRQSEGENKTEQDKQHQWKLTLSFDIEPLGCFYAQIQHGQQTSVQFLTEEIKSLHLMQQELGHLKKRLEELGITVGTLDCKQGSPTQKDLRLTHHLVDVHT